MRLRIILAQAMAFALVLFVAVTVCATPNFPGAIQRILGASAAPQCSICHLCGITGRGTVNTPWGIAMRARGLQPYNEASLSAALAAMERDKVDNDGDGIIDVDAVRMAKDPNPEGTCNMEDDTIPKYGCVGQVSPGGPPGGTVALLVAAFVVLIARRHAFSWRRKGHWLLGLVVLGCAAAACASGAALAPRPGEPHPSSAPRMQSLAPSPMAEELRAMQLDPANLPPFAELSPRQLRRVMSLFTRSLGFACTNCHDANDYRLSTRAKVVTVQMWQDFTRPYSLKNGAVFCDSCHQGQGQYLDRRDKKATSRYMTENFTDKLERHDSKDVECETCHGDPFEPHILSKQRP